MKVDESLQHLLWLFLCYLCNVVFQFVCFLCVMGNVLLMIVLYTKVLLCHCITFVLFRRVSKKTCLVGLNKILIHSMSLNFIDSVVSQINDTVDLNILFNCWQINVSKAEISMRSI